MSDTRLGPIAIIVAMEPELAHIRERVGDVTVTRSGIWADLHATVNGLPLVIVHSGIGMVAAAAATAHVLGTCAPRCVLNFGCAGAHVRDLLPGDVVIGDRVVAHGVLQILPNGEERFTPRRFHVEGEIPGSAGLRCSSELLRFARVAAAGWEPDPWPKALQRTFQPDRPPMVRTGVVASADVWTQAPDRIDVLHKRHASLCEDMEAAAIAQVAAAYRVPFLTIRDIAHNEFYTTTDITRGHAEMPLDEVGRRAATLLMRVLEEMAASAGEGYGDASSS